MNKIVEKIIEEENLNLKGRKKRMAELAAQLKEKKKGSINTLNKIIGRFSIEEGLRLAKVKEYLTVFESIGLIKVYIGKRRWEYNEDAEWELFSINI